LHGWNTQSAFPQSEASSSRPAKRTTSRTSNPRPLNRQRKLSGPETVEGEDNESAPEGVAAFIRTPPTLAIFIHDLLRGPATSKNFYIMPCVGDGGIPIAWLDAGKEIAGGIFCELFPTSLEVLTAKLILKGWTLTSCCDATQWLERLKVAERVGKHLDERNNLEKQREHYKRIPEEKKSVQDHATSKELTTKIHSNVEDAINNANEGEIAVPIYWGFASKGTATIHLFQGNAALLFARSRREPSTAQLDCILQRVREHPGWTIVGVENLPWGNTKFSGKTANATNMELVPLVLAETTPGSRSAFIINRAALVARTQKLVPTRIATLWTHGSIVRLFPLPSGTFPGHDMPMACLFVFRRFTERELALYQAICQFLRISPGNRGAAAPLRYFCGLLAAEDMAWGRLHKKAAQKHDVPSKFADSALDYESRILSDDSTGLFRAAPAQNPTKDGYRLLQVRGPLAECLDNHVEDETGTACGEFTLEQFYQTYRKVVLGVNNANACIIDTLKTAPAQGTAECQRRLWDALHAMTNRDHEGNIAYVPSARRPQVPMPRDVVAAHAEIVRLLRLMALVHRMLVPSFVLEQLTFLHRYVHRREAEPLRKHLQEFFDTIDQSVLERKVTSEKSGTSPHELERPRGISEERLLELARNASRPISFSVPIRHQLWTLAETLIAARARANLSAALVVNSSTPQRPYGCTLVQGPCSQFEVPCGRAACSPMAVLAIAALLTNPQSPQSLDITHILLEGTALYGRLLNSAHEELKLIQAFELSLTGETIESDESAVDATHFNPASVSEHVPVLTQCEVTSAHDPIPTLRKYLTSKGDFGVTLVFGGYTVAIVRVGDCVCLFDSHGYAGVSPRAFCAIFQSNALPSFGNLLKCMLAERKDDEEVGIVLFALTPRLQFS
jgi:hypothetical protein